MSAFANHFDKLAEMDTRPFTQSQPIMAEILTGVPWWENGCAGYSAPDKTLNQLSILTEANLTAPITLLDSAGASVVVNMPLLAPDVGRFWLSDGSMPIQIDVSPTTLSQKSPFKNYIPRAFPSLAMGLPDPRTSSEHCITAEEQRMECVLDLIENEDWETCVWRFSIFDQLAHLLGAEYLDDPNLWINHRLTEFTARLNDAINSLILKKLNVYVLSSFSHSRCRARFDLNRFLKRENLLSLNDTRVSSPSRQSAKRNEALEAILGEESRSLFGMATSEGRIIPSETVAASPVSGCVYINDKQRFRDGLIETQDLASIRERVRIHLTDELDTIFGGLFSIHTNPESRKLLHNKSLALPDFIIHLDGIELHDESDPLLSGADKPRSTHSSKGFLLLPRSMKLNALQIRTTDVCGILGRTRNAKPSLK